MLGTSEVLFYFLAFVAVTAGIAMILMQNPIYCALSLAVSMISVGGLFVMLDAWFIAAVQVIVYAGAVMVLFVMVIMLFDLKHESNVFSKGLISSVLKLAASGVILGTIAGSIYMSTEMVLSKATTVEAAAVDPTKALAVALFTKYVYGFQAIGALLLMIAIGAVTLSRISGGTHADS